MQAQNRWNANLGVGIGTLLKLAGLILLNQTNYAVAMLGLLLVLISIPLFIWGCMNYAEGKGHSKWVGLVGFAGIIGLIVLIILPDQAHRDSAFFTFLRAASVMFTIIGLVLVYYGVAVDRTHLGGPSPGPVPYVCMFLGAFFVVSSLMLMLRNGRG